VQADALATLGLLASLLPPVRRLDASYRAGMYLIYVFSFTVASMARLDAVSFSDLGLFAFVAIAVLASLALLGCGLALTLVLPFTVEALGDLDWGPVIGGYSGALLLGANVLLRGAVDLASQLGVSEVVVGLTVIAIGTSLPELATSVAATLRRQADVAFGNAVGSNVVNILVVLGAAALVRPIAVSGLRPLDVAVFLLSAVLVLPLMARGSVLNRWEGGVLVAGYAAYIVSLAV